MENQLTDTQRKVLHLLNKHPDGVSALQVASELWPDSNMHTKRSNGGHGCQTGKAAWLAAGSYMGRLRKKGLVNVDYAPTIYTISFKGREALKLSTNEPTTTIA